MSCNCNCAKNNCGLPNQPNYDNLSKGFVTPKKNCCCDDNNIVKTNLKYIKQHYIGDGGVTDDENGDTVANVNISSYDFNHIFIDEYCDIININLSDRNYKEINYEYKLLIINNYGENPEYNFNVPIKWANNEAPDFDSDYEYEITISQNSGGFWYGSYTKYLL